MTMRTIYKPHHKTSPKLGYLSAGHGNKRILEVDGSPLHLGEQRASYLVLIDRRAGYPYPRVVLIAKMALDCGPYVTERSRVSWLSMEADVRHFARRIARYSVGSSTDTSWPQSSPFFTWIRNCLY